MRAAREAGSPPVPLEAAEERGAAMSLATVGGLHPDALHVPALASGLSYARPAQAQQPGPSTGHPGHPAAGTDAQIAAELYISVRTVRTHLDRIRTRPAAAAAPT